MIDLIMDGSGEWVLLGWSGKTVLVIVGQGSLLTGLFGLGKRPLDELGSLPQTSSHQRDWGEVLQGEGEGVLKGLGGESGEGWKPTARKTGLQGC